MSGGRQHVSSSVNHGEPGDPSADNIEPAYNREGPGKNDDVRKNKATEFNGDLVSLFIRSVPLSLFSTRSLTQHFERLRVNVTNVSLRGSTQRNSNRRTAVVTFKSEEQASVAHRRGRRYDGKYLDVQFYEPYGIRKPKESHELRPSKQPTARVLCSYVPRRIRTGWQMKRVLEKYSDSICLVELAERRVPGGTQMIAIVTFWSEIPAEAMVRRQPRYGNTILPLSYLEEDKYEPDGTTRKVEAGEIPVCEASPEEVTQKTEQERLREMEQLRREIAILEEKKQQQQSREEQQRLTTQKHTTSSREPRERLQSNADQRKADARLLERPDKVIEPEACQLSPSETIDGAAHHALMDVSQDAEYASPTCEESTLRTEDVLMHESNAETNEVETINRSSAEQYEVLDADVPASGDGHPSPDPICIEIDPGNESEVVSERPQGRSSGELTWPSDCITKPILPTNLVESGHISPAAHPNYKQGIAESNLEILRSEEASYISPKPVQAVASTDVAPSAQVPRRNGNESAARSSGNVTVNANVFTLGSKEGIGKPLRTAERRLSGCEPQAVDINGKDVPLVPQPKEKGISADRGTETAIEADGRQSIPERASRVAEERQRVVEIAKKARQIRHKERCDRVLDEFARYTRRIEESLEEAFGVIGSLDMGGLKRSDALNVCYAGFEHLDRALARIRRAEEFLEGAKKWWWEGQDFPQQPFTILRSFRETGRRAWKEMSEYRKTALLESPEPPQVREHRKKWAQSLLAKDLVCGSRSVVLSRDVVLQRRQDFQLLENLQESVVTYQSRVAAHGLDFQLQRVSDILVEVANNAWMEVLDQQLLRSHHSTSNELCNVIRLVNENWHRVAKSVSDNARIWPTEFARHRVHFVRVGAELIRRMRLPIPSENDEHSCARYLRLLCTSAGIAFPRIQRHGFHGLVEFCRALGVIMPRIVASLLQNLRDVVVPLLRSVREEGQDGGQASRVRRLNILFTSVFGGGGNGYSSDGGNRSRKDSSLGKRQRDGGNGEKVLCQDGLGSSMQKRRLSLNEECRGRGETPNRRFSLPWKTFGSRRWSERYEYLVAEAEAFGEEINETIDVVCKRRKVAPPKPERHLVA
ncbi:RNA recognition motif [Gracilaria domingensis]|nr:RNA recognition motif [Gracilaria domingensis]